ncbi:MAG: hypothetical protein JSS20_03595 [Proteobacteria bacterium]|nr:hypothetical protein [Pseudomonadota bacterium]
MLERIQKGDMVFLAEGQEGIGAVHGTNGNNLVVYVENAGDFDIPASAVLRVHDRKVIVDPTKVPKRMLDALGHTHDKEDPDEVG